MDDGQWGGMVLGEPKERRQQGNKSLPCITFVYVDGEGACLVVNYLYLVSYTPLTCYSFTYTWKFTPVGGLQKRN